MRNYRAASAVFVAAAACLVLDSTDTVRAQTLHEPALPAPNASVSPQATDDANNTVTVPRGVVVPILVTRDVRVGANGSSQEEHRVKLAVDQDVIVDGYVIAKAGDLAEGRYDTQTNQTNRTFEKTTSQEMELDVDDLVNFCGDTIHLKFAHTFVGGTRSGFLSFGVHEHDAAVGRGDVLQASTDRVERHICAEPTNAAPRPLPKNIITPDAELTPPPL